jgi:hypothetical protein
MQIMRCFAAICVSVILASSMLAAKDKVDTRFTIFIVAGGASGTGFTDPDISRQDSTRDIINKLAYSSVWRTVEFENQAAVTIEVLKREAHDDDRIVYVRLIAGDFKFEMQAVGDESWTDAAGRLAKRLDGWGRENAERLKELQAKAAPVPAKKRK